jgi:hypothetical protein
LQFVSITSGSMILALILFATQGAAPTQAQPSTPAAKEPTVLPPAVLYQRYGERLPEPALLGPLERRLTRGPLPPGLHFEHSSVFGRPTKIGAYRFEITTKDSSTPPRVVRESFVIVVENGLVIRWTKLPSMDADRIEGEVEVKNQTPVAVDLTVIIVAVNEIGKAFALGYQHFTFPSGRVQPITFGSTLPRGNYIVHADAVGEIAETNTIYRARLQTSQPSVVP